MKLAEIILEKSQVRTEFFKSIFASRKMITADFYLDSQDTYRTVAFIRKGRSHLDRLTTVVEKVRARVI